MTAATYLTALAATVAFKLALFVYAASGAEGQTSALLTYPRIVLCLGWDVLSAALVAALALAVAVPLARVAPRVALAWSLFVQAIYGLFLIVSYQIAIVVGAPLDKAAIDLWFFYADPTPGGTGRLLHDSVGPYFTPAFCVEAVVAMTVPPLLFLWLQRRIGAHRIMNRRTAIAFVTPVFLTLIVIPLTANGVLAIHTFGLERSPLTMLVGSYLKGPLQAMRAREAPPADPFCFDLRSPVPVDGTDPLRNASPRRTNLVLVILESVGARTLAPGPTPMPFLDGLGHAPGGIWFANHYAHWPQTMKSAFSIWCSELPDPDYPPITEVNPAIPCVSISEALKAADYDTALFTSADLAFDRQIRFMKHRRIDLMVDRNDVPGREGAWENAWGIDERVTLAATLDWVARQRREHPARPFFVTYNMAAGHHPYEFPGSPSGQWLDSDKEPVAQRATLGFVDARLRDLVEGLKRQQLLESTLIAIVSDHGPGSGRAGMGRVRDASIYEGSVRVPLVMTGPQLAGVTGELTLPTGQIDVAPTLLGLLGVTPPDTMKGRDLVHESDGRLVILATRPPLSQFGVRAGRWKLVHWDDTGVNELFDLAVDPDERVDVSQAHRDIAGTLADITRRWQIQSRNLIDNYAAILSASGRRCSSGLPDKASNPQ